MPEPSTAVVTRVADRTRQPLPVHRHRSVSPLGGRAAFLFGIPFVVVGAVILMLAAGLFDVGIVWQAPDWAMTLMGAGFLLPGVAFSLHGARAEWRRRRRRRGTSDRGSCLRADHRWNPGGIGEDTRTLRTAMERSALAGTLIVVLLAVLLSRPPAPELLLCLLGLTGLAAAISSRSLSRELGRIRRFGRCRLLFDRHPFLLGEDLCARFVVPKGIGGAESVQFKLICVEEIYVGFQARQASRHRVSCYQLYADQLRLDTTGDHSLPFEAEVSFSLPDDMPETNLAERPPLYWELQVSIDVPGRARGCTFLLPVYRRVFDGRSDTVPTSEAD